MPIICSIPSEVNGNSLCVLKRPFAVGVVFMRPEEISGVIFICEERFRHMLERCSVSFLCVRY